MELLRLGAGLPCGRFDATQSRFVAVIAGTQGVGGRAERGVIVTGYPRTNFFESDLVNNAPLLVDVTHSSVSRYYSARPV